MKFYATVLVLSAALMMAASVHGNETTKKKSTKPGLEKPRTSSLGQGSDKSASARLKNYHPHPHKGACKKDKPHSQSSNGSPSGGSSSSGSKN